MVVGGGLGNAALLGFGQHERGEPFDYAFFAEGFDELLIVFDQFRHVRRAKNYFCVTFDRGFRVL